MSQLSGTSPPPTLLPEAISIFLRRRAVETLALVLVVGAIIVAASLATYTPTDPSFNTATGVPVQNALGPLGAHVADILFQMIGIAGAALPIALAAWAWRIGSHRGLSRYWMRLALLPLLLLVMAAFAAFILPATLTPLALSGGWLGALIAESSLAGLAALGLQTAPVIAGIALAVFAIGLFPVCLGLGLSEWRAIGGTVLTLGDRAFRAATYIGRSAGQFDRHTLPKLAARKAPRSTDRREPYLGAPLTTDRVAEDIEDIDVIVPSARIATPKKLKTGKRAAAERQPTLDLTPGEYQLPPLSLLAESKITPRKAGLSSDALEQNARMLEAVLEDFGVRGQIETVQPGPVVTLYELEPAPGIKTSRVIGLADDIARSMSAISVRGAVVPGKNVIGLELPNTDRETVFLRELLSSTDYENTASQLTLALGKTIGGKPVIADLARMPHLLIAGTTGSGKSVAINTMILSLLYRLPPDRCKLILIDPKMLELSVYEGIPHLLAPVVTDPGKAVVALKWTTREMESRYRAMSRLGVRNITGYNQRLAEAKARGEELKRTVQTGFDPATGAPIFEEQQLDLEPLPYIVVVVDEMADLMVVAGKDIESTVQRLSQMARAAGIHIIMATQRPSVDVITGTIKANFPTRISFQVTSKIDSRTILGEQGAEQLLGAGDMLYMQSAGRITRVHGPFVSDREVEEIVEFLKEQGLPDYVEAVTEEPDADLELADEGLADELYDKAVALICRERKASTSFVQRHLQIGYNRAARIIERMEKEGVVSQANHVGKREVLARDIDAIE